MLDPFFNWARLHAWPIADRSFKLTAWTLLATTIYKLGTAADHSGLRAIAVVLFVLLYFAFTMTILNVMVYYQDMAMERFRRFAVIAAATLLLIAGFAVAQSVAIAFADWLLDLPHLFPAGNG